MTGSVPCRFSRSFRGRTRTTTWTDAVAAGESGGRTPPRREEKDDDDEADAKDVWSEGVTIVAVCCYYYACSLMIFPLNYRTVGPVVE